MKRSNSDYAKILDEQLFLLRKSCEDFDRGFIVEGIRIAGHIRTLVNDTQIQPDRNSKILDDAKRLENELKQIAKESFKNKKNTLGKMSKIRNWIDKRSKPSIVSKSLLSQMRLKWSLRFRSSVQMDKDRGTPIPGGLNIQSLSYAFIQSNSNIRHYLADSVITGKGGAPTTYFEPLIYGRSKIKYRELLFEDWWNEIIYEEFDEHGNQLLKINREFLIKSIANKDGYAHVDEILDPRYQSIKLSLPGLVNEGKGQNHNLPAHYASIRQIGEELLLSI